MSRIGIYICHCGRNIAGVVDVEALRERLEQDLGDQVLVKTNMFCCAEPGQKEIQDDIRQWGLERVLVAACSPRLHEPTFRRTITQAGLNPYLLEMANIREHCSWVHSGRETLPKAYDLIRMGLAKLRLATPLEDRLVPVTRHALVIGGGVSGLSAALELADCGVPVVLLEREQRLGGRALDWGIGVPGTDPLACFIRPLVSRALLHPLVDVRLGWTLESLAGYVGNFQATLRHHSQEAVLKTGAVVVASGFEPYRPEEERYPHAALEQVLTTVELERMFKEAAEAPTKRPAPLDGVRRVAFQQCVGSRLPSDYPHCSRICCAVTLKQALALRSLGMEVTVYHQDIRLYDKDQEEDLYREARRRGVLFQRGQVLEVSPDGDGGLVVQATDDFLGLVTHNHVDRLVLSVGLRPQSDAETLRSQVRIASSEDGFFLESHPKLHPLETAIEGVFLAGSCQSPKDVRESVASSVGAAAKAFQLVHQDVLRLDGMVAHIDPETCVGCGTCVSQCPYQAIELYETADGKQKARVEPAPCKGCGVCAGSCPTGAADHLGYSDAALRAAVEAALAERPQEKILAFCCNWCAYAGADAAGVARLSYPERVRIVRIPCSGRVSSRLVLHAFRCGAARVLVAGCHPPGDCHYINGNLRFESRVPRIRRLLAKKGHNPDHFSLKWISATEGPVFQETIRRLAEAVETEETSHEAV
ncbi:FAD dependent oxidoreductase [Desulfacinum hydrothermale DSM 13146]|uniref:FAD dependent oxidoreductase n=1 Tax=Desulfacinum hydrothermale DSM 13146 TaxID=1121390 RepID=A0A1W1X9G2_9BACT|nr:hydrogenase iron-sulfur subunit [Desulfacinum hydrothermale]SMC20529.1 FAD dependent oxidoreductase [Desulfacinum hydrothermale DSM 13146]